MASPLKYEDYLSNIYYDPNHAGAYGGVEYYTERCEKRATLSSAEKK